MRLGLEDREAVKGQAEDLIAEYWTRKYFRVLVQEMVAGTEMLVRLR